jgi:hypothetical protein
MASTCDTNCEPDEIVNSPVCGTQNVQIIRQIGEIPRAVAGVSATRTPGVLGGQRQRREVARWVMSRCSEPGKTCAANLDTRTKARERRPPRLFFEPHCSSCRSIDRGTSLLASSCFVGRPIEWQLIGRISTRRGLPGAEIGVHSPTTIAVNWAVSLGHVDDARARRPRVLRATITIVITITSGIFSCHPPE